MHGQLLSVDGEAEVIGDRQLPRAFRQPDDQLLPSTASTSNVLVCVDDRRRLCASDTAAVAQHDRRGQQPPDSLHVT